MTEECLAAFAECQLVRLMRKGVRVADCEAEWLRRWGRPYPWHKTARGWEQADE